MKAYRSGPVARAEQGYMIASKHGERAMEHFRYLDHAAPTGRTLRSQAVFASPQKRLLGKWIKLREDRAIKYPDAAPENVDTAVRILEITNADYTWVYDSTMLLSIFKELNNYPPGRQRFEVDVSSYWNSGIPLTEWYAMRPKIKDARLWEVLIDPADILRERLAPVRPSGSATLKGRRELTRND